MTREKRTKLIRHLKYNRSVGADYLITDEDVDEIIKALEQEPCDDAISRQEVLDQTYLWSKDEFLRVTNPFDYLRKRINSLPPVTPQEPILDKIKAEIDSHCSDNRDRNDGLYIAMKIIDKYRT